MSPTHTIGREASSLAQRFEGRVMTLLPRTQPAEALGLVTQDGAQPRLLGTLTASLPRGPPRREEGTLEHVLGVGLARREHLSVAEERGLVSPYEHLVRLAIARRGRREQAGVGHVGFDFTGHVLMPNSV